MRVKRICKTVGRVLLIGVGGFLIFTLLLGVCFSIPQALQIAREAVLLEEPVIRPENEGKVVILHGELVMLEPATDPDLGLTFETPVVNRHAESYRSKYRGGKCWRGISAVPLVGRASLGEFEVDPEILKLVPAETEIHNLTDLTALPIYTVTDDGRTYASPDDIRGIGDGFFPDEGYYTRDAYTAFDLSTEQVLTVVGIQEDGKLLLCDDLEPTSVHVGEVDGETVLSTLQREEWITVAVVFVLAAVCLFFGFKGVLYLKPKETQEGKKTA